jgi:hypothetical protein
MTLDEMSLDKMAIDEMTRYPKNHGANAIKNVTLVSLVAA